VVVSDRVAVAMWQWHDGAGLVIPSILIGDKLIIRAKLKKTVAVAGWQWL
jgi:hypothetical protein